MKKLLGWIESFCTIVAPYVTGALAFSAAPLILDGRYVPAALASLAATLSVLYDRHERLGGWGDLDRQVGAR